MRKVMTRNQNRPQPTSTAPATALTTPGTPGGRPPGTPAIRTAPPAGRPPGSGPASRTRPADNRPPTTRTPTARVPAQTPRRPIAPPQPHPADLFAERLLAVLTGRHPVHAMLRHTLGEAYDDLARLAEHGPLRTARGTTPVLRDLGYELPRPGAIEAFARISTGPRLRAMAFRLELGMDRRWRCTAVELDAGNP
ncbi:Rv3235 family protein [Streptomyces niveiscabiei]|uniref:Rv3235 family protein n=1 Tax=Streptomyces niveiscabiei TaxID=164115 RepID=UPI0029AF4669|nr:Rv3235 family protein [Streptomyces niveiscabiei]MDX3385780.1 Rv3235 family protein [Streptomyces niveiscabiei]